MSEKIKINLEQVFPLISCKQCKMEFVMIGIIRGKDDGNYYQQYFLLGTVSYCPYCGYKFQEGE